MMNYKNISCFLALFALNNILYFTPSFGNPYYGVMALGALYLLLKERIDGISSFACMCLIFAAVSSILCNDIPARFHPWLRLGTFVVVLSAAGPLFRGKILDQSKIIMFWTLRVGTALVAALSLPARLVGMGRFQLQGYYSGLTVHSITMGLLASNAMVYLVYVFFTGRNLGGKLKKTVLFAIVSCFACSLAAASRAGFISGMGGVAVFILLSLNLQQNKVMRYCLVLAGLLAVSYPFWQKYADKMISKNHGEVTTLDISSREKYWRELVEIFKKNPLSGCGFSYLVDSDQEEEMANSQGEKGQVEPGNSWLVVLAMTGTPGGIAVACMLWTALMSLHRQFQRNRTRTALLCGLLMCEFLHMFSEGYILAAGGFGFFNFWCLMATIFAYDRIDDDVIRKQLGRYAGFLGIE